MYSVLEKAPDTVLPATTTRVLPAIRWRLGTRIAFRFSAAYFTLYVLATQMIGSLLGLPAFSSFPPLRTLTTWVATDLVGFSAPLVIQSGSGDKPFDWALSPSLLAIASAVTVVWSLLDRSRPSYVGLCAWFHLFVRLVGRRHDDQLWDGEGHSAADAVSEPLAPARALRTLFAHGRALGPGRRVAGLRALHGLRRVERRNPPLHTWPGAAWRCRVALGGRRSSSCST